MAVRAIHRSELPPLRKNRHVRGLPGREGGRVVSLSKFISAWRRRRREKLEGEEEIGARFPRKMSLKFQFVRSFLFPRWPYVVTRTRLDGVVYGGGNLPRIILPNFRYVIRTKISRCSFRGESKEDGRKEGRKEGRKGYIKFHLFPVSSVKLLFSINGSINDKVIAAQSPHE